MSTRSDNKETLRKSNEQDLYKAARAGNSLEVEKLLEAKANVNATSGNTAETALHIAAFHDHFEIVQLLLQAQADIHAKDASNMTPLLSATEMRTNPKTHSSIVKILLEAKANANAAQKITRAMMHCI